MFLLPNDRLYWVGVMPSSCLNTFMKYFSSENPQENAVSFTGASKLESSVLAAFMRS